MGGAWDSAEVDGCGSHLRESFTGVIFENQRYRRRQFDDLVSTGLCLTHLLPGVGSGKKTFDRLFDCLEMDSHGGLEVTIRQTESKKKLPNNFVKQTPEWS